MVDDIVAEEIVINTVNFKDKMSNIGASATPIDDEEIKGWLESRESEKTEVSKQYIYTLKSSGKDTFSFDLNRGGEGNQDEYRDLKRQLTKYTQRLEWLRVQLEERNTKKNAESETTRRLMRKIWTIKGMLYLNLSQVDLETVSEQFGRID